MGKPFSPMMPVRPARRLRAARLGTTSSCRPAAQNGSPWLPRCSGSCCSRPEYSLDAQLEPAYAIFGSHVPRTMLQELSGHRGSGPAADDSLVVSLDWHGRPGTD